MDEYLNFKAGIFPILDDACYETFRVRTEVYVVIALM